MQLVVARSRFAASCLLPSLPTHPRNRWWILIGGRPIFMVCTIRSLIRIDPRVPCSRPEWPRTRSQSSAYTVLGVRSMLLVSLRRRGAMCCD